MHAVCPAAFLKALPVTSQNAEKTSAPVQANGQQQYSVTRAELPLSCPSPAMALWNSHPRVFLPVAKTGFAKCPYCGAEYTLVD